MPKAQSQAEKAFDQVVDWLEHFEPLDDPRQRGKVWYRLDEVLLLCLLSVLAGAESWVEVAEFGKRKLAFLRRFRSFENGTPSHDQLGDLFAALDAEQFQRCFITWAGSLATLGPDLVAIDGKTLRRSYQEGGGKAPIHMISASWRSHAGMDGQSPTSGARPDQGRGQVQRDHCDPGSSRLADAEGLDGDHRCVRVELGSAKMGCQREIAAKIIEKEADYMLALKGNQGTSCRKHAFGVTREDVELFFAEQRRPGSRMLPSASTRRWRKAIHAQHGSAMTPPRDQTLHRDRRHRLAQEAPRLGRLEERRHGRERA